MATSLLGLDETELCLGLPDARKNSGKRASPDQAIDLKLQLQTPALPAAPAAKEAPPPAVPAAAEKTKRPAECGGDGHDEKPPAPKARAVGWPPVRSFRKNILAVRPEKAAAGKEDGAGAASASFVKVSMDGAPYLRKVDLKMHRGYPELFMALKKMFISFGTGGGNNIYGGEGILSARELMNESKVKDALNGSEFVPTYEDRDGDWMLMGDVPWEMFVDSCKRLRIMKGSEAIGLAPRAMEKCKNRS